MYFGKQNSTNSYYYDDYNYNSSSLYRYDTKQDYLTTILKILVVLFFLVLLAVGFIFLSNNTQIFKSSLQKIENIVKTTNTQEVESKDTKKVAKSSTLTQEDIANIVSVVMYKLDEKKSDKKSAVSSNRDSDDDYAQKLLLQDVDNIQESGVLALDLDSINAKRVAKNSTSKLAKKNHYNKVVISKPKEDRYTNDRLSQLSIELDSAMDDSIDSNSDYTQEISKELSVRSNEMRTIVVAKGDTLSKIAKRAYGNYDDYVKIFEANPEIIKNPDEIYVGQRLRIPL